MINPQDSRGASSLRWAPNDLIVFDEGAAETDRSVRHQQTPEGRHPSVSSAVQLRIAGLFVSKKDVKN